ncbi:hypothetical protein P8629_00640 [Hydrogenovibrio sp. 3SP14C1]|uniref:phosphotransferase n=1 Tax=Hydrogenovibrio sp. 3SP14C1 TaxID=3038774 RepID=UPI0024166A8A|nr:phosphotransferase [Hydrogenovibrio sp. 3SP14C1]MDG4811501.1 hypothetical protein [Hydrogenovibrio sp. 3SP14C1]
MPSVIDALKSYFAQVDPRSFKLIPSLYEDSSHHIFLHEAPHGKEIIKALNSQSTNGSDFWQGMERFFGIDLKQQVSSFESLYPLIAQSSPLDIPTLLETLIVPSKGIWAIKTDLLSGQAVQTPQVTSHMVRQLAEHLAKLHQIRSDHFGYIANDPKKQMHWPLYLKQQLNQWLTDRPVLSSSEKDALISQIDEHFQSASFGVIMPDLRWDQFLQLDGRLTALTDLDALVFGPVELDWVLLEFLLTPEQAQVFCVEYARHHPIPAISDVRAVYRMMLFLMNVLGEKNYQAWRDQPRLFN